jgi:hypothetical protein
MIYKTQRNGGCTENTKKEVALCILRFSVLKPKL